MSLSATTPLSALKHPVKIHSRILASDFWLVPDNSPIQNNQLDGPTYTCAECCALLLLCPTPDQMRRLHLAKTIFDGDLTLPEAPHTLERQRLQLTDRFDQIVRKLENNPDDQELAKTLVHLARQLSRLMSTEHLS